RSRCATGGSYDAADGRRRCAPWPRLRCTPRPVRTAVPAVRQPGDPARTARPSGASARDRMRARRRERGSVEGRPGGEARGIMDIMKFVVLMAVREIRASWRRLLFFFVCVAVGVGAIVMLRSLIQTVRATLARESRAIVGADVVVGSNRAFPPELRADLEKH